MSGSAFLPFIDIPSGALRFTSRSTLKTIRLTEFAERTFCTSCGAPITMAYKNSKLINLTVGSIEQGSLEAPMPKVKQHIFLKEKAPWLVLPEDGAERLETWESAHLHEAQATAEG